MQNQPIQKDEADVSPVPKSQALPSPLPGNLLAPGSKNVDYTDGRSLGEWQSKYPAKAINCIRFEGFVLFTFLVCFCAMSATFLSLSSQTIQVPWLEINASSEQNSKAIKLIFNIDFRLLMIFFVGCLGGTTFSIKWLVHSVAKCKWHLDRRYWRFFVPLIGGVYACVVLTLFDGGILGAQNTVQPRTIAITAALAFLVGYFSDGVSGLLSNIANAVFGTLEKK